MTLAWPLTLPDRGARSELAALACIPCSVRAKRILGLKNINGEQRTQVSTCAVAVSKETHAPVHQVSVEWGVRMLYVVGSAIS